MTETAVEINTSPNIPRDPLSTLFTLIKVSGELNQHLKTYLQSGDLDDLRRSTNCMMIIQSMQTKEHLTGLVVAGIRGEHPVSSEERAALIRAFETTDAPVQ